ncbi:hypothetical protein E6C50_08400 [Flavobacterium supellecticarium]|uniref:Uncharacterized protein n=1 Tax=Flavobacterium supellecticarium TaxID=2565924 RepID=A0A4S4A0I5_9FLAO|nr:hypothetical protein [Flavobacterium supellecticarium]THF51768.1 hypothetical protein E6C50_08400 [Flavobacterium supellecticarium]
MNTTKQENPTCQQKVKPAGIAITGVKVNRIETQIDFPNPRHDKPLPPISQATVNKDNELEISIVVFISANTAIKGDELKVIQDFSYTNDQVPYANFYVCYDIAPEPCATFNIFQVNFTADPKGYIPNATLPKGLPVPNLLALQEIVTFLWDEDPVGSRGTVTTVQSGV